MSKVSYEQHIEQKSVIAINKATESASSNLEENKLLELKERQEKFKASLKKAITPEITEDEQITNADWQKIYDDIPKSLLADLKKFNFKSFNSGDELKKFIENEYLKAKEDSGAIMVRMIERRRILAHTDEAIKKRIDNLLADPALRGLAKVDTSWIPFKMQRSLGMDKDVPWIEHAIIHIKTQIGIDAGNGEPWSWWNKANIQAMISRNLYFQNKKINKENVNAEAERILQTRKKYENVPIFSRRNIVLAACSEQKKVILMEISIVLESRI